MIFSELYSAYYNAVAWILKAAIDHPLSRGELREMVAKHAFGESVLNIEPALTEERWQLIRSDGTTPIQHPPTMPLTTLQKRWLKAIYLDPRIRLFTDEDTGLDDVEPLFTKEDYLVFDKYSDGDPYEDEEYIANFRLILDAIRNRYPLEISMANRRGRITHRKMLPETLEYSEKDDKFRLIGASSAYGETVNLGRIMKCKRCSEEVPIRLAQRAPFSKETVEFELTDERNALERVLLHFAHFEKEAERIDEKRYLVRLTYNSEDEAEMVIRILSFGPMIRVIGPQRFVDLIKERLNQQKSCGL
ncbi:MAG: WYL domain-containing protein [Oscillospiraceae bacterium]|nr:WYL domain-containing protein [Oscillospiraceae bacterium]